MESGGEEARRGLEDRLGLLPGKPDEIAALSTAMSVYSELFADAARDLERIEAAVAVCWWEQGMRETQQRMSSGGGLLSVDTDVAGFNNAISGPGRDAIEKLDLARLALERAGNEAADALVAAQAHAPAPATWYETAGPTLLGLTSNTNPKVKAELAAGAVRGVLDVAIVRLPTRPYLDQALDLWSKKHGINPNSGIHSTARIVAPAIIPIPGVAGLGITTKLANRSLTRVIEATPAEVATTRTAASTAGQILQPGSAVDAGVAAKDGLALRQAYVSESQGCRAARLQCGLLAHPAKTSRERYMPSGEPSA